MSEKEKLYNIVVSSIGEVVEIPPIEYCYHRHGEMYSALSFNFGSVLVNFQYCNGKSSIVLEDEWSRPQFYTVNDIKYLLS